MQSKRPSGFTLVWFLAATLATPFSVDAVISLPGGLTVTKSDNNLILSFPTTSTNYYGLQTCPDLSQSWVDIQSGIPGNGYTETVTLSNTLSTKQGFYRLSVQSKPSGLLLPQSDAFAALGHSCGGIQEKVYATGFDPVTGYPTGNVDLSTRCGGSGRGGGYHTTTYTASVSVIWDFAGNVISYVTPATGSASGATFTDGFGDILYNSGANAFLIVPVPGAPVGVTAVQSGDQFQVAWTLQGANPAAITSSILTAAPVNSPASVLATTVAGPATNGIIDLLQPSTTYQVTVATITVGGTGPASVPVSVTTGAATVAPSAPTGVTNHWSNLDPSGTTDTLITTWQAAVPGDSPVDQYQITIIGSDGGGTLTQTVSGTTLTAYFNVDYVPNWTVTVQAHNAIGWGPASTPVTLGGL
jgi:hypothetical protein